MDTDAHRYEHPETTDFHSGILQIRPGKFRNSSQGGVNHEGTRIETKGDGDVCDAQSKFQNPKSKMPSPHPRGDGFDDLVLAGAVDGFEFGGEGHGDVEGGDPQRGGFELAELLLGEAGDQFGPETVGAPAFVDDNQAAGAGERGFDQVEPQRGEGAQVKEVEARRALIGEA